jgi:hypothetical protein
MFSFRAPLFISLSLVNVGSRRIPTHNVSLLITKGVVLNEEPSILAVFSSGALLQFKGERLWRERSFGVPLVVEYRPVKDALPKARLRNVF